MEVRPDGEDVKTRLNDAVGASVRESIKLTAERTVSPGQSSLQVPSTTRTHKGFTMKSATLRRFPERAVYDVDSVASVFRDSYFAHVAYVDTEGFPQCLPMIALFDVGEVGADGGESPDPVVYLHGHLSTNLMEMARKATRKQRVRWRRAMAASKSRHVSLLQKVRLSQTSHRFHMTSLTSYAVDGLVLSSAPNGKPYSSE